MKNKIMSFLSALLLMLSFSFPVFATSEEDYYQLENGKVHVIDMEEILNEDEWEELEVKATNISVDQGCGVYVVILDDYELYGSGSSVYNVATEIYNDEANEYGFGENRDGILLLLSMEDRDYALFVHGEKAEYAFNDYARDLLEDAFLDDFGDNDWNAGLNDYLDTAEKCIIQAAEGKPVKKSPVLYILGSIGISMAVAFIICWQQKEKMESVHAKEEAKSYAVAGVQLTAQSDQFTHTTVTRRTIEKNSSSSRESGGGGSGRSGKF